MKSTTFFNDDDGFDFSSFLSHVRRHIAQFPPLTEAVAMFFALRDPKTPWFAKAALATTLAYFLTPLDLIPDPWLPVGLLDDIALIAATLGGFAGRHVTDHHRQLARQALGQT